MRIRRALAIGAIGFLANPFLLVLAFPGGNSNQDASPEQIRRTIAAAWESAAAFPYEASCIVRSNRKEAGKEQVSAARITVKNSNQSFVQIIEPQVSATRSKEETSRVLGRNSQYEFHLSRSAAQAQWLLAGWQRVGEKRQDIQQIDYQPASSPFFQHLSFEGKPLNAIMMEPSWKLRALLASPTNGSLTQIQFDYSYHPRLGLEKRISGWMDLDPAAKWCIHESDISVELAINGNSTHHVSHQRNEYHVDSKGLPVLSAYKATGGEKLESGTWKSQIETTCECAIAHAASIPESEFTLMAFGLPEPPRIDWKKPTPWYLWVTLAGVGLLAIGAAFRWLRRRYVARPSPA